MARRRPLSPVLPRAFAHLDLSRQKRLGAPEIIYGAGKTSSQIAAIIRKLRSASQPALATRVDPKKAQHLRRLFPKAKYYPAAQAFILQSNRPRSATHPSLQVAICAAGTSDHPVAEEAFVTLQFLGHRPTRFYDIGVAGLHRTIQHLDDLRKHHALIVVAGMEAALPSVLGGLIGTPLIAVPTSVGYGAHLKGITALLGMLNSCSPGITVVNIDNGFGAAYSVHRLSISLNLLPRSTK
jgi:pyridinium-3,5-biscarboxylic acid mononucleotide synthase